MNAAAADTSPGPFRILVLGGYGNFGARICRALAPEPSVHLVVGARDLERARHFARQWQGSAVGIDISSPDFARQLQAARPDLVIHTAGPFQAQHYAVAQACAAAGASYIDLADGRRFVCDFPAATAAAFRAAGRCGISGASTVPGLSSAVVDQLTQGWQSIDSIEICVAPAQSSPRGVATMAAVLSYCGRPVRIWRAGRWQHAPGWAQPAPVRFARMAARRGALCDIPDLEIFPEHYHVRDTVMFRAALEVRFTQSVFAWLAALRHRHLLPPLEHWAPLLHRVAPWFDRWGTQLGGMYVAVTGSDATGRPAQARWDIAADHDHGPEIPTLAAILLARQLARGDGPAPGAHTATGLLPLDAFAPEFARWGMVTDTVTGNAA